ncbi:sensor histidine kinase [Streptomyces albipurpureus]|uniref:histidine kinase n=1 Tax=Streptomyces albipurpureus TaxID=2897419 RepID=A0ABT0UYU5_9ACTN|nr:histidine kinase [Streptomyces sp. CWNU-1]MCM2393644.1 histidine kinase [Streptomyces sp. CWNU-1]
MARNEWTAWPVRESLTHLGVPRGRIVLDLLLMAALSTWALSSAYASGDFAGALGVIPPLGLLVAAAAVVGYQRTTLENRLVPSLALLATVTALGWSASLVDGPVPATVLWITASLNAMERLPLGWGLGLAVLGASFVVLSFSAGPGAWITFGGVLLAGFSLRLDAQARGAGFRLLAQERAAREAEAFSAALAERARIAREIHDVLAHSLSAQLVHLEAARLQIERGPDGPFREQILERVVAARGMARDGLAETRQALSALRGEIAPIEDYLRELAQADGTETEVAGEGWQLTAEISQTIRRVAQEALTNARKHAPGARVRMLLSYDRAGVTLEVRDSGARKDSGELGSSGSGYGLLGMRERAELLGGTLDAGPEGEGFVVRLRVPV